MGFGGLGVSGVRRASAPGFVAFALIWQGVPLYIYMIYSLLYIIYIYIYTKFGFVCYDCLGDDQREFQTPTCWALEAHLRT